MKIVYLGLMFCEQSLKNEIKNRIASKGIAMSTHKFQQSLTSGIALQENVDLQIVNVPPTGSFPKNNKSIWSKTYYYGKKNKQIGYLNLPIVKHVIQQNKIYNHLKKIVKNTNETVNIIVYSLYKPFLVAVNRLKKRYSNIKIVLIQTDAVPGRNDMEKYMSKKAVVKGNDLVEKAKVCDAFILLTKYLADVIETDVRPYKVIECVCDENQTPAKDSELTNVCLYTGAINKAFGLKELVDAFSMIKNAELWLCGKGDAYDYALEKSKTCSNVKVLGYLTQQELAGLRDKCNFLINPRRPSGTYTKYSFPSKTAEYMMTAKPVVMYKLEGVPDEYDKYLNYLKGATPEEIAKDLEKVFACDYQLLKAKAKAGREFMLAKRTSKQVGKEMIEFINLV